MKLRNLFLAVVAGLFTLTGCELFENDKPLLGITVDPSSVEIPQAGGDVTIKVATAQNWIVSVPKDAQEWVMVSPESGSGSATITIGAGANTGKARKATISVKAGYDSVPVTINQAGSVASGDGSKEKPFSPSEARAWVLENVASGEVTSTDYYVAGKIHKVQTTFEASGTYGNAVFFMSDDGNASDQDFEAFQVYYLGKRKWKSGDTDVKVGDDVIVCGPLTNYNGTPETAGKGVAYLYKLNDQVVEVDDTPQTEITASTVDDFIKSDGTTYYRLTGVVTEFKTGTTKDGKNYMQFNLTDATGTILVYGFKDGEYDKWAEKIKDGGTVVLNGTYEFYQAKSQHEVMNTTIESFTEGQEQTEFEQLTVAAFIQKADPTKAYRLVGKVEEFSIDDADKKYMKITLKDDTGSILVYSFVEGEFDNWSSKIVKGGDITLRGYYKLYNNEAEVINATIESFQADPNYKYFGVEKDAIRVSADATKATIKVVSNVAWTAKEATGADVATGEGTREFDFTFPANTDTESEKVYSVVVSTEAEVEVKSVTVTITQAKAGQAGEVTVTFTQEQLAAAACKGAAVNMDEVISFTNTSDYGTTAVTELRIYKSKIFTVTAAGDAKITGITIECTKTGTNKEGPGCWGAGAPDGYTFEDNGTNGYWSGSASSVAFTATDNQVRIKSLTVTYVN